MPQLTKIPQADDPSQQPLVIPFLPGMAPQQAAGDPNAPGDGMPRIGDETPLGRFAQPIFAAPEKPDLGAPAMPAVTNNEQADRDQLRSMYQADRAQVMKPHLGQPGSKLPGWGGKILHGLAEAGNIAGDIFAPSTMALIPGTDLNNIRRVTRDNAGIDQLDKDEQQQQMNEADIANKNASTEYTEQRPDLERARILQTLAGKVVPKGFKPPTYDDQGNLVLEEDPNSQAYKSQQALQQMHDATAARDQVLSDIARNHYVPGTPEYAEAQRKLAQVDERLKATLEGLGLRAQTLAFHEDQAYNPEPTGFERNHGDLATSALNQVQTLRSIIQTHPEMVGPGGEAKQAFQRWLSSNAEDAGRFKAAATYLADHSAGVFGGRSEYVLRELKDLTNPNYDPSALMGVLDQAQATAQHFAEAGQVHGKGQQGFAAQHGEGGGGGGVIYARDPQGKLHQAPAGTPLPAGWKQENR